MVTSEINYDSGTIVDLENDSITPEVLLEGETAHDATGASIIGTMRTVPDSAMLGGKAPEYYLQPMNLLNNSYFVTPPVNQRGQTVYKFDDGYTIDRWRLHWTGEGQVTVKNGCIELYRPTHNVYLFQHPENPETMVGKTYTVAAKCRYNGTIGWIDSTQRIYAPEVHWDDWGILTYTFTVGSATPEESGMYGVEIKNSANLSFEIAWVALYEGSYTAETLPPYVPKGYAAELMSCLRYLHRFRSAEMLKTYCDDFCPPMRQTPNGVVSTFEATIDGAKYYFANAEL